MTKLEFQPSLAIEKEIERKKRMFQRCVEIRIHSLLLAGATLVCSLFVLPVLFFVLYKVLYRNRSLRQDQLQLHQFAYRRFVGGFFSGPFVCPANEQRTSYRSHWILNTQPRWIDCKLARFLLSLSHQLISPCPSRTCPSPGRSATSPGCSEPTVQTLARRRLTNPNEDVGSTRPTLR